MFFRPVTIAEANTFLPLIKERFDKIHSYVEEGQLLYHKLAIERLRVPPLKRLSMKPDGTGVTMENAAELKLKNKLDSIEERVQNEIAEMQSFGAIVRSVQPPRVLFLARRHMQPVYLSWQLGEDEISYWHQMDEGFSFRREIDRASAFGQTYIQ